MDTSRTRASNARVLSGSTFASASASASASMSASSSAYNTASSVDYPSNTTNTTTNTTNTTTTTTTTTTTKPRFRSSATPTVTPPSTPPRNPRARPSVDHKPTSRLPLRPRRSRDSFSTVVTAIRDPPRHSHGLSWNSTTRDSVVDNLLFSLDNISRHDEWDLEDEEDAQRHQYLASLTTSYFPLMYSTAPAPSSSIPLQRPRGHTHSSSDSEYPRQMDSPARNAARGRRSTSSSNAGFANTITSRIKSNGFARRSTDTTKAAEVGGSDGMGATYPPTSTHEVNQMQWGSRTASVDRSNSDVDVLSVVERGRPVPSVHSRYDAEDDADAAPEPTIAAGPRKKDNPTASGPVYVNALPSAANAKLQKSTMLRKTTTQSDLKSPGSTPSPPIPPDIRNQAADFVRTSSMRGGITGPLPPAQTSTTPSSAPNSRRRDPSPAKEKPGFFKRVFGGGSSRAAASHAERPNSHQVHQHGNSNLSTPNRSASQPIAAPHGKDMPSASSTTTSPVPQTLNKKPSSFFRRRKKSATDSHQPPLPTPADVNASFMASIAQPSPSMTSLRKVMDPYLSQDTREPAGVSKLKEDISRPATRESKMEDSEDPDIFHTGYTPPADASLAAHLADQREPEAAKMKVKNRKPDLSPHPMPQGLEPADTSRRNSRNTVREQVDDQPSTSLLPPELRPPTLEKPADGASIDRRPSTGERIIVSREASPAGRTEAMRDFSAETNVSLELNEEGGWYVKPHLAPDRPPSKKSDRLVLRPTASEEKLNRDSDVSGSERSAVSVEDEAAIYAYEKESLVEPNAELGASTPNLLPPAAIVASDKVSLKSVEQTATRASSPSVDENAEYRERARRIFEGDEEDVPQGDAAAWLGERNTLSTKTLQAYMQLFDFAGMNALSALRMLCSKLMLRGETQQFDRIITALSARWCECNPNHGFKAQDVVHTIFYSIILLNTDLHLADIEEKMTKSAYVKNTLPTIRRVVQDAAPDAFEASMSKATPQQLRPSVPWTDLNPSAPSSPAAPTPRTPDMPADRSNSVPSQDTLQASAINTNLKRLSIRPAASRNDSDITTPGTSDSNMGSTNALVNSPWMGSIRGWEMEIEIILKSFFTSIRNDPLPLLGVPIAEPMNRNLSIADMNGALKRNGSVISRAPSDNVSYRSGNKDFRSMAMRWPGRVNRSRPKLYPASTVGSSRTSFDDGSGFWSPAQSSKHSFSKTLTSASVGSFSNLSAIDNFKHSIGFANALSQANIREETNGGDTESFSVAGGLLEDESLALEGAPWAKEGLVKHKHHLDAPDRKAKERNWNDCFAVISNGKLTLFAFNTSTTKTQPTGRKGFSKPGKAASVTSTRVGGGDWMENAEQLDVFVLRQTIASTLPPPGYSKTRPHVWALSLPSGAVHLFQVGTPEIAIEFMTTANYWSARLSKEPLAGGVSNVEYGWSENVIPPALLERPELFNCPPSSMQTRGHAHSMSTDRGRTSLQSSLRNSFDTGFGNTAKNRLPGDKTVIHEWQPPTQSMMASQLMEVDQLKQLTAYVQASEEELEKHNELKHGIELVFSPRHPNYQRAITNWQRKSDYLLREIVKFRTYMDSLSAAQKAKEAFYAKKAEGRLSPVSKGDDDAYDLPGIEGSLIGNIKPRVIHTSG